MRLKLDSKILERMEMRIMRLMCSGDEDNEVDVYCFPEQGSPA